MPRRQVKDSAGHVCEGVPEMIDIWKPNEVGRHALNAIFGVLGRIKGRKRKRPN